MKAWTLRKSLLLVVAVMAGVAAFGLHSKPAPVRGDLNLELQAPAFVGAAQAQENSIASVIGDEAGIAAYFNAGITINLTDVRDIYRTIEHDPLIGDPTYILGSVPVTNYNDSEDVHVYVSTDGWFMAYYLDTDLVTKIIDWQRYHNSGRTDFATKLETVLTLVAAEASLPSPSVTYYDFRFPDANRLTLVGEWVTYGIDSFQVTLPGTFTYNQRGWSYACTHSYYAHYKLDGNTLINWAPLVDPAEGALTVAELLPDTPHTFEVSQGYGNEYTYGGFGLVYRIP